MIEIGLISAGEMGASVGAAARTTGNKVCWAGDGRSQASHERAAKAGLTDVGDLASLVDHAELILSICPPHEAEPVARAVSELGFRGCFVDCNAISPARTARISELFDNFVDGGIIGGPAWKIEYGTRLYLSGENAEKVTPLFEQSPLQASMVSKKIGDASALKMVFAAYSKGSTALLTAILGVAESYGVRQQLESQWGEEFSHQTHKRVTTNTAKAWRFSGEMKEIADTFNAAGFPAGFHGAAAEVFESLASFKDEPASNIEEVLQSLASNERN